jgi:hypothetical protein
MTEMRRKWLVAFPVLALITGLSIFLLDTYSKKSPSSKNEIPEGWLGLNIHEIQQRVGDSEIRDDPNPRFSDKFRILLVRNKESIDITQFTFLKEEGQNARCLSVMFLKSQSDHKINPKDVDKLLIECYGQLGRRSLQRVGEENISNGKSTNEGWKICWEGSQGEQAEAQVLAVGGKTWFSLICDSGEYLKIKTKPSLNIKL